MYYNLSTLYYIYRDLNMKTQKGAHASDIYFLTVLVCLIIKLLLRNKTKAETIKVKVTTYFLNNENNVYTQIIT